MLLHGSVAQRIYATQAYTPDAVYFDGSSDYLYRPAGSSITTQKATISVWINPRTLGITSPTYDYLLRIRDGSGSTYNMPIYPTNGGATAGFVFGIEGSGEWNFNTSPITANQWNHILLSYDFSTATPNLQVYINDVFPSYAVVLPMTSPATQQIGSRPYYFGREIDGSRQYNGDVAELYFTNEFLDLSVEANRRKFITATGTPVELGADGSTPTGTQPLLYFKGDAATWNAGTNFGSLTSFSMIGSVTDATTEPVQL